MTGTKSNSANKEREVLLGCSSLNRDKFDSNYISTTKYTALTFLPLSLLLQFKRYANIYFLFMAILQSSPLSPLNPFSSIAPLVFVISLSIIREGFEDMNRNKSDLELNSSKTRKYQGGGWSWADWKDIYVGDFIKVEKGEFFPADLICLCSSDPNGNCYIKTSSLDGEKNAKPRMAFTETQKMIGAGKIMRLAGEMNLPPPSQDLYDAKGVISIGGDNPLNISVKNFLLRGSILEATDWVIGVCAYTGRDTKIMNNSEESKYKQTNVERMTNQLIILIFLFQVSVSVLVGIFGFYWTQINIELYNKFIPFDNLPWMEGILAIGSSFVLTNSMIPISLIISLEMVKMAQAYFINMDEDMISNIGTKDIQPSKVFTSSLNEELGQIEFVFSDKTGTLTCNKMEFKICVVGDILYGDQSILSNDFCEGKKLKPPPLNAKLGSFYDERLLDLKNGIREDKKIDLLLPMHSTKEIGITFHRQYDLVKEFFFLLSVCHDCVVEKDPEMSRYQGESPDEITLVDTAHRVGYSFVASYPGKKELNIFNQAKNTQIKQLQYFAFNSDRKRASVIIEHEGLIKLMIKGADSFIIERLGKHIDQPYLDYINKQLDIFSGKGLRTLCMAERILTKQEYSDIEERMKRAIVSIDAESLVGRIIINSSSDSRRH